MAGIIVVGSGLNGLSAAITLVRAGCGVRVLEAQPTLGGAVRSAALTLLGFIHDQGAAYRRLVEPFARRWPALADELLRPMIHLPWHPLFLAGLGIFAMQSATGHARRIFRGEKARALFAGFAAHSFLPLEFTASASFALVLAAAGHAVDWPLARGGSQAISDALASYFRSLGGTIETDRRVEDVREVGDPAVTLLDLTAWQAARVAGPVLPARYREKLAHFPHGPSVFKIDFALDAPIPWTAEPCRRAGTLHLGGTLEEIADAERQIARGELPARPFVLVAQPSLFDPTRAPAHRLGLRAHSARLRRGLHRAHRGADRTLRPRLSRPHPRASYRHARRPRC